MKQQAQVVVIGGGIVGCAVCYYLARLGCRDVVLLEKNELTAGSTWHAAGNYTLTEGSLPLTRFHALSWRLFRQFETETKEDIGFHRIGALLLARSADVLARYRHRTNALRYSGTRYEVISAQEAGKLNPLLDTEGLLGAAYVPDEGYIDPTLATHAFARQARALGAEIRRRTAVTSLDRGPGGAWEVGTANGAVTAGQVVICGGFWSASIAAMAGVDIPVIPVERQFILTEPVPELSGLESEIPLTRDAATPFYFRQEGKALLCGLYEHFTPYCFVGGIPDDFGQELLPGDLDRGAASLEGAITRVPALGRVGIRKLLCGPTSRTPDMQGLLGPIPGQPDLFVAGGFSAGISDAAAIGHTLANWLVEGSPGVDTLAIDVARFGRYANRRYAHSAIDDASANRARDPSSEKAGGRPALTSPLYHFHQSAGALSGARSGWECPLSFPETARRIRDSATGLGGLLAESVALADLTATAKLEVMGHGAESFLATLFPSMPPERENVALSPLLDRRRRVVAVVMIVRIAGGAYLTASIAAERRLASCIESALPPDGSVTVRNVTNHRGILLVLGDRSRDLLADLAGDPSVVDVPGPMAARHLQIGYSDALVVGFNMTGRQGWEIHHDIAAHVGIFEQIRRWENGSRLLDVGLGELDDLRVESGWPLFGVDFGNAETVGSAGLEGLAGTAGRPPDPSGTSLVHIRTQGQPAPATGCGVFAGDELVGLVTSAAAPASAGTGFAIARIGNTYLNDLRSLAYERDGRRYRPDRVTKVAFRPEQVGRVAQMEAMGPRS